MRGWLVFVGAIAAAGVFAVGTPSVAHAQGKRGVPVDLYYQGFAPYFDGEFADAQRIFRDAAQAGHRVAEVRWIDSVCYHAMLGDALFHQGRLNEALDQYTSAIKLYLANRDWILRTEFDTPIEPFTPAVPPTWARSTRVTRLGRYPLNFSTLVGRFDNDKVFQQGGVVAPPEIYPVNVIEIMRCFSQAIRRRREILGPTCEHDPLTGQLAEAMARRPGQPNHWSQCWISLALGLSYASANKPAQAATELTESLLAGGQYEHALSGMALLELGKLAWEKGEQDTAAALFVEASLSAAAYDQYEVVEEALRWGATAWTVSGKPGVYPPLAQASAWAKQKHIRTLHVSLLTLAASGALEKGETAAALQLLTQAKASIGSANLPLSDYGARLNYAAARHAFQA
jgi:tetratricopeptide (TPR) repeat protein